MWLPAGQSEAQPCISSPQERKEKRLTKLSLFKSYSYSPGQWYTVVRVPGPHMEGSWVRFLVKEGHVPGLWVRSPALEATDRCVSLTWMSLWLFSLCLPPSPLSTLSKKSKEKYSRARKEKNQTEKTLWLQLYISVGIYMSG